MATDDDIKKIAKGIGAIIATAGAAGLVKVVTDSSKKSPPKGESSEIVRPSAEEINQMYEERRIQEQIDAMWAQQQMEDMWALHDAEQEEFQKMGERSMDWSTFGRNNFGNFYDFNDYVEDNDDYDEEILYPIVAFDGKCRTGPCPTKDGQGLSA